MAAILFSWAKEKTESGDIEVVTDKCVKSYTRFKTKGMSALLPDSDSSLSGWGTPNYYFYEITDPEQTAWIFGDRLAIHAGGQTTTLELDPSKLHKRMASDATWLSENYVMNADEQTIAAFRRIANAGSAYIVYYKQGGKARRHDLRPQEIQRIQEMVHLYDRLNRE